MLSERIEKLRQQYTDQYVTVDAERPELARFKGTVGQVKTVNMSGRALVQFVEDSNRGWYDVELDYLKVVDKPQPKPVKPSKCKSAVAPEPKAEKTTPAPEPEPEKLSPLELARLEKENDAVDGKPKADADPPSSTPGEPGSK